MSDRITVQENLKESLKKISLRGYQ